MDRPITEYVGQLPIRAFVVGRDAALHQLVKSLWPSAEMEWQVFDDMQSAMLVLFNTPPAMILVDTRPGCLAGDDDYAECVRAAKSDNAYSQVIIVLCIDRDSDLAIQKSLMTEADDFMFFPDQPEICKLALSMALSRSRRSFDVNPLSHLPGNSSIIQYVQSRIDQRVDFALGYADLDHFKAFNDKYGFSRGDEVLLFTARVISGSVRASGAPSFFIGHIGGDDFIFVLPVDYAEAATQRMISSFDAIVSNFYDVDDQKRGSILTSDRQGKPRKFPILSLSIAVTFNFNGRLKRYAEAAERVNQLKSLAKKEPGSVCRFDRRQSGQEECNDAPGA